MPVTRARSIDLRPAGLWTDPNPHSEVPPGALSQADDVILRRPGVIESRPGFATAISGWTPPAGTVRAAIPFDGDVLLWSLSGSTWTVKWLSDGDTVSGPQATALNPAVAKYVGHASARQSLYTAGLLGVQKIESATDTTSNEAGMCRGLQGLPSTSASGSTWLAHTDYVAYRILYRRTDTHDYDVRGAPSGRVVVHNVDGAARCVSLRLPLPANTMLVAGDVIEVYRSITTSNDKPSDDLYLALEHKVTSANLSTGYVDILDQTPENSLGRSLYTNDDQQGAEQENGRPPVCHEIAAHRGSLFFGRTTSRAARVLRCLSTQDWRLFGNDDGIEGDLADMDATLSGITGIVAELTRAGGIAVGQYVVEDGVTPGSAGTYIPANTKVSALNDPDSIEMSNAATGTAADEALNFCDVITIGTTDFVAWSSTDPTNNPPLFRADTAAVAPQLVRDMAQELAYCINYQGTYSASVLSLGAEEFVLLVEDLLTTSDTNIEITNGWAWSPGGVAYTINGEADLLTDARPNRLFWSKTDEPEAVPPTQFVDIGEESKAILRLLPTRDALWVAKEDGLWRLTGAGADSGWRVDPVGPDTILLERKAAAVLRDAAVMWTQRGVVMVQDTSVEEISDVPIGATLDAIESAIAAAGGSVGAWMAAKVTDDEVYLGVPLAASDEFATDIYVFNAKTKAWTRWQVDTWFGVLDPDDDKLTLCDRDGAAYGVTKEGGAETFVPEVAWQARSEGDPFICKRWGRVDVAFDTLLGVDLLQLTVNSDISLSAVAQTLYNPAVPVAVDKHTEVPGWVPRQHCMSTVLYPRLTITQSTTPGWRLVGLSIQYDPMSIRPRRVLS